MLMGHPPQRIARSRENRSQGGFEGLTPVQVPMVVEELVACDAEVQETLADPLEAVQKMAQTGPDAFHCVAVHTRAVRVTTSILACTMVNHPMVIVSLSETVAVVCIGEELCPDFHLGSNNGFDGRGAHIFQHFQIGLRSGCVLVGLVAALPQAQDGWTPQLGGGSPAKLNPALSGCACAACDFTGEPFAARTLVALVCFHVVLQVACRVPMVRL